MEAIFLTAMFILSGEPNEVWPASVEIPKNLVFYQRTEYAQHLTITNGRDLTRLVHQNEDDHFSNAPTRINPNRIFPWKVNGGLDRAIGWHSKRGIALPDEKYIRYWTERIEAGARRPLPKITWQFPVGTKTVDLLINDQDGKVFELRMFEKTTKGWTGRTAYRGDNLPKGYVGLTKRCAECHDKAGAWLQYGALVRGSDNVFSFPFLVEGKLQADRNRWPAKEWSEK